MTVKNFMNWLPALLFGVAFGVVSFHSHGESRNGAAGSNISDMNYMVFLFGFFIFAILSLAEIRFSVAKWTSVAIQILVTLGLAIQAASYKSYRTLSIVVVIILTVSIYYRIRSRKRSKIMNGSL